METPFLTPEELATRWNTTPATLSQWRWNGRGPLYTKIGRGILYNIEDIKHFESQKVRRDTTCSGYGTLSQESSFSGFIENQGEERSFYVKDGQLTST